MPPDLLHIIAPLLKSLLANWHVFALLLGLLFLVSLLKSPRFKGWLGEYMVRQGLRGLDKSHYTHFHDLYLPHPSEPGTTQIDHAIVSPFGIFVIETKNYQGWIFGSEKQREWTQQIYCSKHRFQNPLHQNKLHVRALIEYLHLPENSFLPIVLFIGGAEFKTPMPDNVLNRGLIPWIKRHQDKRIVPTAMADIITSLQQLDQTTDRKTAARQHLAHLKARHSRS